MKKTLQYGILLTIMILGAGLFHGCNRLPSGETVGTNAQIETALTPETTAITTAAKESNPLGFDPNNPEGWSVEDWDAWQKWMEDHALQITEADYSIGEFTLGMPLQDAKQLFQEGAEIKMNRIDNYLSEEIVTYGDWRLEFSSSGDYPYDLSSIKISGSQVETPRGLRVGDTAEKLYELYGIPVNVHDHEWTFEPDLNHFTVTVLDGVVKTIEALFPC